MKIKYGTASNKQIKDNEVNLVDQIFKLLPYKENNYQDLDYYFSTLLFRITGLNKILGEPSELITVLSLLESARTETDFKLYRKAILDSCAIMTELVDKVGDDKC